MKKMKSYNNNLLFLLIILVILTIFFASISDKQYHAAIFASFTASALGGTLAYLGAIRGRAIYDDKWFKHFSYIDILSYEELDLLKEWFQFMEEIDLNLGKNKLKPCDEDQE